MGGAPADGAVLVDEDGEDLRATDVNASGQHDPPSIEAVNRFPDRLPCGVLFGILKCPHKGDEN